MMKSKVESSVSTMVKVESSMVENKERVESIMVENKVKVEFNMVEVTNFNQKMNIGDDLQIKTESSEKRKSLRLTNKGPDEKRRLIG